MSIPVSENFEKLTLNGPATGNLAPGAALEAQTQAISDSRQKITGALFSVAESPSSLTFAPLQYGGRLVSDVQNALFAANELVRPSDFLKQGLFKAGPCIESAASGLPDAIQPVKELSVFATTKSAEDLVNKADNSAAADFLIGKDGSIKMLFDPDRDPRVINGHELVIALEGDDSKAIDLSADQKASFIALSKYLGTLYIAKGTDGSPIADINDNGLLSDAVKQALGIKNPEVQLAEDAHQQVGNQASGANYGAFNAQDVGNGRVDCDPGNRYGRVSDNRSSEIRTPGYSSTAEQGEYTTVRDYGSERGLAVGRYQLTYDMFMRWLFGLDLDSDLGLTLAELLENDKDHSKFQKLMARLAKDGGAIDQLVKDGKITAEKCHDT